MSDQIDTDEIRKRHYRTEDECGNEYCQCGASLANCDAIQLCAEYERLKRTVDFQEQTYLEQHGGSWGKCYYQAENERLREENAELWKELNAMADSAIAVTEDAIETQAETLRLRDALAMIHRKLLDWWSNRTMPKQLVDACEIASAALAVTKEDAKDE
jgi:hypothetical protein